MAGRQDRDDEIIRDIEEEDDEEFEEIEGDEPDRERSDREEEEPGYQTRPTGEVGSEGGSYGDELGRRHSTTVPRGTEATETARVEPARHGNRRTGDS